MPTSMRVGALLQACSHIVLATCAQSVCIASVGIVDGNNFEQHCRACGLVHT